MLFPYNEDGSTYGYTHEGKRVCTGAKMGRYPVGNDHEEPVALRLRRVPLDGGGYDGGGAYWGSRSRGESLFCAWSQSRDVIRYVDARSREHAQDVLREMFPNATF